MITNFNDLKSIPQLTTFQSTIITNIEELLEQININQLDDSSFIDTQKKIITISFVHKQDTDIIITLNITKEYSTLWVGAFDFYFDNYSDEFDISSFIKTYKNSLTGNYKVNDFLLKNKLIAMSLKLEGSEKVNILPLTFLYKFYMWLYKKILS